MEGNNTKLCKKCKEVKSVEDFYRLNKNKDGLQHYCKICLNEMKKKYEKQCLTCNNSFTTSEKNAKFCSRKCMSFTNHCIHCKESFTSSNGRKKFCSKKCNEEYVATVTEKKCTKCGLIKDVNEFNISQQHSTGRASYCKECTSLEQRKKKRERMLKEHMERVGYKEVERKIPADINLEELKHCPACSTVKPLKEYHYKYGQKRFNNECKTCSNERRLVNKHKKQIEMLQQMREERGKNNDNSTI